MKPIEDLPKDFFENVTFYPLDHRAGKYNISTDDYFIFGFEDRFRGVKRAFNEDKLPFYLSHQETFNTTKQIFYELSGFEPDLLTEFHDKDKTWNAFIVTHSSFVKYTQKTKANSSYPLFDYVDAAEDEPFINFPLIGGFNNYSLDKNPAFFYLIGTPFQPDSGSLLTLDNFRFTKVEDKRPFVVDNRKAALDQLVKSIAVRFKGARANFDKLLVKMTTQQILKEEFAPVVLDLYNRNRNPQSIRNDDGLRHRVKRLYINAANSVKKLELVPWTEFIRFIIRYNQFYFYEEILLESVEELFSRKDSYQKFETLFNRFLTDRPSYERYVNGQVIDWERIKENVLNSPTVSSP